MEIKFIGGTGTVTGSKYLLTGEKGRILVDCGLFQGLKTLRLKNWSDPPFDPAALEAVVLTHAHIDHSGYIPLLVKRGFKGRIYCTPATAELCNILLPDAGYLQEEEARYMNKHRLSKHKPALPLFNQRDAQKSLGYFSPVDTELWSDLLEGSVRFRFKRVGHILGAALIEFDIGGKRLVFSGDLGRQKDLTMKPPERPERCDVLVVESTYGNRLHEGRDPFEKIADVVNSTVKKGGVVVVPSFAVGRAQELLYVLYRLKKDGRIPEVPVYLNSPMATDVTELFCRFQEAHKLSDEDCRGLCEVAAIVHSADESKALNSTKGPMVIISASGMATGGRVVHHLKAFLPDPKNTVLFTGFQAMGTRGAAMLAGAETVKIHGQHVPVKARIEAVHTLSAHADYSEELEWLKGFPQAPKMTFVTHGEPEASESMRFKIKEELGWEAYAPEAGQEYLLESLV